MLFLPLVAVACSGGGSEGEGLGGSGGEPEPPSEEGGQMGTADASAKGEGGANGALGGDAGVMRNGGSPMMTTDAATADALANVEYDPCPAKGTACRIMPLGDSITEAFGYRVALYRKANAAGRTITFVGLAQSGPATVDGKPFPRQHEGHSGFMVDGIAGLIGNSLSATDPHIVLLMIGTNDAHRSPQVATAPARVGALVDTIARASPNALIVVAKIVPTQVNAQGMYYSAGNDERVKAFNAALGPVLEARQRAGAHVLVVDMYDAFTANPNYKTAYMADNLHPNSAGYAVMGNVWWNAIEQVVK